MTDKAKEVRAAYYREYRAKNKQKMREIRERYWEKKAKEMFGAEGENGRTEDAD